MFSSTFFIIHLICAYQITATTNDCFNRYKKFCGTKSKHICAAKDEEKLIVGNLTLTPKFTPFSSGSELVKQLNEIVKKDPCRILNQDTTSLTKYSSSLENKVLKALVNNLYRNDTCFSETSNEHFILLDGTKRSPRSVVYVTEFINSSYTKFVSSINLYPKAIGCAIRSRNVYCILNTKYPEVNSYENQMCHLTPKAIDSFVAELQKFILVDWNAELASIATKPFFTVAATIKPEIMNGARIFHQNLNIIGQVNYTNITNELKTKKFFSERHANFTIGCIFYNLQRLDTFGIAATLSCVYHTSPRIINKFEFDNTLIAVLFGLIVNVYSLVVVVFAFLMYLYGANIDMVTRQDNADVENHYEESNYIE